MTLTEKLQKIYNLSDDEIAISFEYFSKEIIKSGTMFLRSGEVSGKLGFIVEGLFRTFKYDIDFNEITTGFSIPGTVLISAESFNRQIVGTENIIALKDSELFTITSEKMKELYKRIPVWQTICFDVAEIKNLNLQNRLLKFQTLSARDRYNLFCTEYPELIQSVPLKYIASYLGIDPATLSRVRKKQ